MPWFWIVAGPNGAGKSTLTEAGVARSALGTDLLNLNADVRTRQILAADPAAPDATLRAAIEIDAQVAACIEQGIDFLVETVLSSDKVSRRHRACRCARVPDWADLCRPCASRLCV
jgi:predicted ABC-type ATPase